MPTLESQFDIAIFGEGISQGPSMIRIHTATRSAGVMGHNAKT